MQWRFGREVTTTSCKDRWSFSQVAKRVDRVWSPVSVRGLHDQCPSFSIHRTRSEWTKRKHCRNIPSQKKFRTDPGDSATQASEETLMEMLKSYLKLIGRYLQALSLADNHMQSLNLAKAVGRLELALPLTWMAVRSNIAEMLPRSGLQLERRHERRQ